MVKQEDGTWKEEDDNSIVETSLNKTKDAPLSDPKCVECPARKYAEGVCYDFLQNLGHLDWKEVTPPIVNPFFLYYRMVHYGQTFPPMHDPAVLAWIKEIMYGWDLSVEDAVFILTGKPYDYQKEVRILNDLLNGKDMGNGECPECHSKNVYKHGSYPTVEGVNVRFQCQSCGKSF